MTRRVLAVAALAALPLAVLPAAPASAIVCPRGTVSRPTGLYHPLTGKMIYVCAPEDIWVAP